MKKTEKYISLFIVLPILLLILLFALHFVYWVFSKQLPEAINVIREMPIRSVTVFSILLATIIYFRALYKKRRMSLWTKVIMEIIVVPIVLNLAILSLPIIMYSSNLVVKVIILYIASTFISIILVFHRRKNEDFQKLTKVVLDYLDSIYWILITVFLFLFAFPKESFLYAETFKFFIFPLIIQVKILKAFVGHLSLKLNEDPKPLIIQKISSFFKNFILFFLVLFNLLLKK